jgi:transposase-like protein
MAYIQTIQWHIYRQYNGIYTDNTMAYIQTIQWHIYRQYNGIYTDNTMAYINRIKRRAMIDKISQKLKIEQNELK